MLATQFAFRGVDAHGYLKTPRSRNYYASIDPIWWGGTANDPAPENCPHCLNIGGTEARCGKVGDHNYDAPPNAIGLGVLPATLQACYEEAAVIDIESVLTAHHKGHFEIKACPVSSSAEAPTQECFDKNPLVFVSDELYGAKPDPLYPERAYIPLADHPNIQRSSDGNYLFHHKYRLPDDLRGDLVLIQWYYITANSCKPEGYDTYDWPEGFFPGNVPVCDVIPPDGRGVPEQFWNCAEVDIRIANGCSSSPPVVALPTSSPTPSPSHGSTSVTDSPTENPNTPTTTTTSATTTTVATTTAPILDDLVLDTSPRCGFSELDARESCNAICATDADCDSGEFCWNVHANYCGSIPQRLYEDPVQSPVVSRCGVSEEMARTFCGEPCSWQCSKPGEQCIAIHSNYCDSPYTEVGGTTTQATSSTTTTTGTGASTNSPSISVTKQPSNEPTNEPTKTPTSAPINPAPSTLFPSGSPISRPPTSTAALAVESVLEAHKDGIDNNILVYQNPSMQWEPSSVYRYQDMLDGIRVMYNDGVANKYFYMGEDTPNGHLYGIVNIAAFLAQSMKETIQYNACDENSWDLVNGMYPVSNACGQLGQSYQDYKCSASEAHMECPVKTDMEITATTNAKWWGAPAPLYCGPKEKYPFTGFWDHSKECNKPWADPPEYCDDYDGQQAGGFDNSSPVMNSSGRTDVEGCCFWGRGVIQTTGVCNFGKLNYYLGARAAEDGRDSRYPDINFCEQPDAICASEEHKELKWIAGMFYWVESLQSYNVGGWDYITELQNFVDNGMSGNSFIDAVSGIVNRGCHDPPCATGDVDGKADRSSNFYKVLAELDVV